MRRINSVILAMLSLACFTRSLGADERLNFAYISPNAGSSSVLWIAKDAGIFKKHGLDVNMIYIEGTPKALMSLFAGELQVVAGTGPAVASARVRGADASMIMGFEVFLPYYLIATSAIKSVEDLKGKVGANHSAATSADFAMRLGLRNIGLDPERDVSLRVVGATNLRVIAMQQGQAQFTVISTPEREEAEKLGFKILVDLASKRIPYPHSGVNYQPENPQGKPRCHLALRPGIRGSDSLLQKQQTSDHRDPEEIREDRHQHPRLCLRLPQERDSRHAVSNAGGNENNPRRDGSHAARSAEIRCIDDGRYEHRQRIDEEGFLKKLK